MENLERQKRFVTDASHELKTPLAILAADVELLRQPNTEQSGSTAPRHRLPDGQAD